MCNVSHYPRKLGLFVRALFRGHSGQAMIMAIGFLFAGTALVTGSLVLASTTSRSSQLSIEGLHSQYAAIGGSEFVAYRLSYQPGYADSLPVGVPVEDTITLNGKEVTVTILKLSNPPPPPDIPPVEKGREFYVTKEVTPTSADPYVPTTYTYTISITNRDSEPYELKSIRDRLPAGFEYVSGSSYGISSLDPILDGQGLKWNLGPDFVEFQPMETRTQTFQAQASVPEGNYGNEAWVEPGTFKTSTDLTARVTVGSPPSPLWQGAHASIEKTVSPAIVAAETEATVTYTIRIENTGTETLTLLQVRDLLPPGGQEYIGGDIRSLLMPRRCSVLPSGALIYVPGTTSGLTSADPSTSIESSPYGDRQELDWSLRVDFAPGETKTLSFQATGTLAAGDYYNEAWATFNKIGGELYTWPTAVVKGMGVLETTADDGSTTVSSQVWIGNDMVVRTSWEVTTR